MILHGIRQKYVKCFNKALNCGVRMSVDFDRRYNTLYTDYRRVRSFRAQFGLPNKRESYVRSHQNLWFRIGFSLNELLHSNTQGVAVFVAVIDNVLEPLLFRLCKQPVYISVIYMCRSLVRSEDRKRVTRHRPRNRLLLSLSERACNKHISKGPRPSASFRRNFTIKRAQNNTDKNHNKDVRRS